MKTTILTFNSFVQHNCKPTFGVVNLGNSVSKSKSSTKDKLPSDYTLLSSIPSAKAWL